jgi:predicted O-methyltransferase YrrM
MQRILIIAGLTVIAAFAALSQRRTGHSSTPALADTEQEKKILAVLDRMVQSQETYLSVPIEDGKALRLLTEAAGSKHVGEVGTSTGYSGLWFSLALLDTGGHLTTFEIDPGRASQARAHFQEAGVEDQITVVVGDAHQKVSAVEGPVDVVFIDADKEGYVDYLNKLLPKVRPGGLILAHNFNMAPDYVRTVTHNPKLETIFYTEGNGLAVTLKKR